MHGNAWASLLRHIPPQMHDQLVLVTVGGTEIALSTILRIDHEFLAFKGRLAASQDQGRLFFLPFQNIDYLGFYREVKDEAYHEVFGNLQMPQPQAVRPPETVAPPEPEPAAAEELAAFPLEPETEPQPESEPIAPSANVGQRVGPIKSAILERFRSRSNLGTAIRPNGKG